MFFSHQLSKSFKIDISKKNDPLKAILSVIIHHLTISASGSRFVGMQSLLSRMPQLFLLIYSALSVFTGLALTAAKTLKLIVKPETKNIKITEIIADGTFIPIW